MLGCYSDFPTKIHGIARYNYQVSTQQLQKTIVHVLHQLNQKNLDLKTVTKSSPNNCELRFEFGIAEHDAFNFLDNEELERLLQTLDQSKEPVHMLDFFCAMRYYTKTADDKRRPLRFDYALLRFSFYRRTMEVFMVHERGTRRVPLEDLVVFLTNRVNDELKQNGLKPLTLKHLHAL
jgi:hypothetical protein